jgi:hypothetical protein
MVSSLSGPKTETVVVLTSKNDCFHSRVFQRLDNRIRIESNGTKYVRILVAFAPLAVSEGVHGEMKKAVRFTIMPL